MKLKSLITLAGIIPLLASCASERVALAPVGPNPTRGVSAGGTDGYLRVFTAREPISLGDDPIYYQHTDYSIYDAHGKWVKHVDNTTGHFATSPRVVPLPPGQYTVRARATDYLFASVPVVIESGRTTSVHLDDRWTPPATATRNELVFEPSGSAAGWKAPPSGD